jgi:epoxyqueuosine reductase
VVIAIAHETDNPDLDWWDGHQGTQGNRILIKIINTLAKWVKQELNINTHPLPYHIERGGIFLKDAAVLAGLGCIGKNNLLLTPEFGPRVRLRAMLLDAELEPDGLMDFNPCEGCDAPCMENCPPKAFSRVIYSPVEMDTDDLPGRNGCYDRTLCNIQMEKDIKNADLVKASDNHEPSALIKYCRRCEIICPAGK